VKTPIQNKVNVQRRPRAMENLCLGISASSRRTKSASCVDSTGRIQIEATVSNWSHPALGCAQNTFVQSRISQKPGRG